MKSAIKKTLKNLFPKQINHLRAYRGLIAYNDSYLHITGWMRSLEEGRPVTREGKSIPWMNYAVIRILEARLTKDLDLFEYGSGYSTGFYAGLVNSVVSLEYDQEWMKIVEKMVPANASLIYMPKDVDGAYCRAIQSTGKKYDVVIVDGRDRVNCVKQSLEYLTERGVLILDDSGRSYYAEGIEFAIARGFRALPIEGIKATGNSIDQTTILYRSGNCLNL